MKKKCRAKAMVELFGSLLVGVIILTMAIAYAPALAELSNYNPQGLQATTLEQILVLPDEEIDLATAILILSKEWDASLNIKESLEEINKMALEVRVLIDTEDDPERIVALINHYLFENKSYAYVDYPSRSGFSVLEQKALPQVIKNKKGDCVGLSLIYLALTERLKLPFYGVAAPGHLFVRYDNGEKKINIETTDKGKEYEDSYYEKEYELSPTNRKYNFYLRNLSKKETVGAFLTNLGIAYYDKGMYDEAIVQHKKAIEMNPNNSDAYINLGVVYADKGMYDEAMVELTTAIEIHPNSPEAYTNLGVIYKRKGMYDDAVTMHRKAIEIKSDFAQAYYNLGIAYYDKGMYDEAIVEFVAAIEINSDFAEAHRYLGIVDDAVVEHRKAMMYDEAIVQYKKAISINPEDDLSHYNLGRIYHDKGMYDEAIVEFVTAIEINSDFAEAHFILGETYYRKGEYSSAIEYYNRAMELGSSVDPTLLELLEQYKEK